MYIRPIFQTIYQRLNKERRFIQVLAGPRQTGKTTLAKQLMGQLPMPSHYATADEPTLKEPGWIEQQWEVGRMLAREGAAGRQALLVLDEIQKIPGWSEMVKRLWDEDSFKSLPLHVVLLGSAPLLMQKGLSESLAGRFELNFITHWSFPEMREAFGWNLSTYIFYGGYPGAAVLIEDYQRWANYILHSLIETTVSRDILLLTRVDKPALLRRLFELGCAYSGQVLSYQKMLGQLHDAGNTTTLAHYLHLLEEAGLLKGVPKYAGQRVRQRASSPKLIALNTALMSVFSGYTPEEAQHKPEFWGRLVETAVGAHLANATMGKRTELFYWSSRNREVDFVLTKSRRIIAIEVKSTHQKTSLPGLEAFSNEFPTEKKLLVGGSGIPLDVFLSTDPEDWFK